LDNSSNSDKLTPEQRNDLEIRLNKAAVLRSFLKEFNVETNTSLEKLKSIMQVIDSTADMGKVLAKSVDAFSDLNTMISAYERVISSAITPSVNILRNKVIGGSWCDEWAKANIVMPTVPADVMERIKTQIKNLSDFGLGSLLVGPTPELFIDSVKSSEPIYIFFEEKDQPKLDWFLPQYNELFQRRLRIYDKLWEMPKNTLGIITVWNYLHLRDTKQFDEWIAPTFYSLLKAGGVAVLNYPSLYNSEDYNYISNSVFGAYDSDYIETSLVKIGFEVVTHDRLNQIIVVKKPGFLNTKKASPTISTIVNIDSIFKKQ